MDREEVALTAGGTKGAKLVLLRSSYAERNEKLVNIEVEPETPWTGEDTRLETR